MNPLQRTQTREELLKIHDAQDPAISDCIGPRSDIEELPENPEIPTSEEDGEIILKAVPSEVSRENDRDIFAGQLVGEVEEPSTLLQKLEAKRNSFENFEFYVHRSVLECRRRETPQDNHALEDLSSKVADTWAENVRAKWMAKIDELICDENGDRLEKRVRVNADFDDNEEFLRTWEKDGSMAASLIEKFIDSDAVTEFLQKGVANQDAVVMRSAARKIKSLQG